ncbi:hypothetical protein QDA11_gp43 [Microbacterium phage Jayden]|uniref:Uncharacterized protein n=1 Tax=Microbacterium phage Jayden TaxID=2656550 RepID=A0A649VUL7_9CAUD|nr:hypothetical protein QDA11_gp43 [Microbacterium phage Jayden]QGJ95263.1 hypothetical protein PBI_JAYDEN_43 [Microbacterium phage Jayden]
MSATMLTDADRSVIKGILEQWRESGVLNPLLPMDVDVDGDGIVDAWGLDAEGEVIFVSGASLPYTVYESEGDDVIAHEGEPADG